MGGNIKENVARSSIWLRLVWMIVLGIAFNVAEIIVVAIAVFQFFNSLFTGNTNENLSRFSRNLARYLQQIVMFLTFAVEDKPFPFSPWAEEVQEENIIQEIKTPPASAPESNEAVTIAGKKAKPTKKPATRRVSRPKKTPPSRSVDKGGK